MREYFKSLRVMISLVLLLCLLIVGLNGCSRKGEVKDVDKVDIVEEKEEPLNEPTVTEEPLIISEPTVVAVKEDRPEPIEVEKDLTIEERTEPIKETELITEIDNATMGERNALKMAQSYLEFSPFSREGLIEQLDYEGYTSSEAIYAVDNCGADWNKQAVGSAQGYLEYSAFSKEGLVEQLEYEGYTNSEAKHGVNNCGADWYEQAAKAAQNYLDYSAFSRSELIDQLEYEGFSTAEAEYGVSAVGY